MQLIVFGYTKGWDGLWSVTGTKKTAGGAGVAPSRQTTPPQESRSIFPRR
jgi:hypothetical protein